MDIFNKKKVSKLEAANEILRKDNRQLLDEIDELKNVIKNKGYFFPDVKHLIFRNDNQWLVQCHFNSVINAMNAHNIEIVDNNLTNNGFDIHYRLPKNIKSASFAFKTDLNADPWGTSTYETSFKFVEK